MTSTHVKTYGWEGSVLRISEVRVFRNTEVRLRDGPEPPPRETKHFSSILETLGGLQKERQGDQALACVFRSLHG